MRNTIDHPKKQSPIGFHAITQILQCFRITTEAVKAINQDDLRNKVVLWKSQFFGSSWASYDLAKPGTFRLVPKTKRLPALRRDYQLMRDMYLTEPVSFDDVLNTLSDLEHRINHANISKRTTRNKA